MSDCEDFVVSIEQCTRQELEAPMPVASRTGSVDSFMYASQYLLVWYLSIEYDLPRDVMLPSVRRRIVDMQLEPETWWLVRERCGRLQSWSWYVYGDFVSFIAPMLYPCSNCNLALITHSAGRCLYEPTRYSLHAKSLAVKQYVTKSQSVRRLSTGESVPLLSFIRQVTNASDEEVASWVYRVHPRLAAYER